MCGCSSDGRPHKTMNELIEQAVDMLNNPWDYEEKLEHYLPEQREYNFSHTERKPTKDPNHRIFAQKEELTFSGDEVLYVKWDDSAPLNARSLVHRVIKLHGLDNFYATGTGSNTTDDDADVFPVPEPDISWLKVGPQKREKVMLRCEDCGSPLSKYELRTVDLTLTLSDD